MRRKLLVFDVGNSRLKAALYDDGRLIARESLSAVQDMAGEDWDRAQVVRVLESRFAPKGMPDHCLVASVVRGADAVIHKAVQTVWAIAPKVVDTEMDLGIDIAVPRPDHVGIDRLLQASEAVRISGGWCGCRCFWFCADCGCGDSRWCFLWGNDCTGFGYGVARFAR